MPKSALGSTAKERVLAAASLSKKQAERERERQAERLEEQQRRTEELRQAVIQNMSTPARRQAVYANARALDSNPTLLGRTNAQNQVQTEADRIRGVQELALSRAGTGQLETIRDNLVNQASSIDPNVDPASHNRVAEQGRMVQDVLDQRYSQDYENAPFQWKAGQNVGYVTNRAAAGLLGALEGAADAGAVALADERYGKVVPGIGLAQSIANLAGRGGTFRDVADKALTISPTNDYRRYIEENYTPGNIARGVGELADTVTNMAPSIAANIVLPGSGLPLMALQSGGSNAQEAYQNGATLEQASTYGLASGALEAGTEMMFGGLAGLGRGVLDTGVGNVVNQAIGRLGGTKAGQVMSRLAQNSLVKALADSAGEGVEEVVSTVISPYLQRAIYDPDAENASADEIVQSALLGAAAGGVFQGLGAIARRVGAEPGSNAPRDAVTMQRQDRGMLIPGPRAATEGSVDSAPISQDTRQATAPQIASSSPESFIRNELNSGRKSAEQISNSVQNKYRGTNAASALSGMMQRGEVSVDAAGKFYARDLNSHIDNRDMGTVGNRSVNAFQFDNPALHEYYVGAAQDLLADLADSVPADRFPVERMNPDTGMVETVWTGNKRYTTDQIASLLDDQKLTYNDIQKAAQAIIENHGQDNYAAAKRVELVLDDMLTNGWRDVTGRQHGPDQAYISAKSSIPGAAQETERFNALEGVDEQNNTASTGETASLVGRIRQSIPQIENMQAVATVTGDEIPSGGKLVDRLVSFINSIGNRVNRPGFGDVLFSKGRIKNSMIGHGVGNAKIETFAAVPEVIQNGVQIDYQPNWKGRVYDTYVFAAPINYRGNQTYLGVVVTKDGQDGRYYVHEVVDENGNTIYQNNENTEPTSDGRSGQQADLDTVVSSVSNNSIPQTAQNVNQENTEPRPLLRTFDEVERERVVRAEDSTGAAPYGFDPYSNMLNEHGAIPEGENPARVIDVPVSTDGHDRVSRAARTVMEAEATPESMLGDIAQAIADGELSHEVLTDKKAMAKARTAVEESGFADALAQFKNNVSKGIVSKDNVALGQVLLNNAMNAGDAETAIDILADYAAMATSAGQALQAQRIFKKLSPEGQLYGAQRSVRNLVTEIQKNRQFKDLEITIDPALEAEFLAQTDQDGRYAVLDKIYQNVADQVPSTWRDKWNAWRYMAMLFNPRTHIRNTGGNLLFQPVRITKDRVAAGLEQMVSAINPDFQRTKSFAASPGLYKAAWNDWKNVKDVLSGNKYDDIGSEINRRRTVFQSRAARPLELARRANSAALEYEDAVFKRFTYADALAGYLQANGVTAEQMNSGQVDKNLLTKARDYAGQEALKATYQDRNQFSDLISSRFREGTTAAKVANTAIDAVLPFRRTPANILVRGFEYSPAGLIKSLTSDLVQVKRGNMSGAEAIDHIAAGLTGSGLFALGAWLLSDGLVTSGGSDDQEQEDLNTLTGKQNYALNLPGGGSVTLDWLAPEALPFFMGVEFVEALGEGGFDLETVTDALSSISEPMLELSMLQSLNDLIDSVSYAESSEKMVSMAGSALVSYLTQAIPTLGGQIERTTESDRMSSFTDRNSSVPRDLQYALSRASARLPGDYQQIPYIDAWGRTESNGGLLSNAFNNFLNPAYTSKTNETEADQEIQRLLDAGQTGVVPDRVSQSQKVDGQYLSADQYVQYATTKGQTSYDIVSEMIDSDLYQGMTDEEKANAIKRAYQYAGHIAAAEINPEHESEAYVANAKNAQDELGVSAGEYLLLYGKYGSNKMSRLSELVQDGMSLDDAEHLVGEKDYGTSDLQEYSDFVSAGVSEDSAESLVDALSGLEPEDGKESVTSIQKYRAVLDAVPQGEQMAAFSQVMSDSEYEKLSTGNRYGVSPSAYVDFKERVTQYDADGNGSLKQSEVEASLDSYGGGLTLPGDTRVTLTNDQKAVLWQLQGKSWSPKNNPYNTRIGQQVYDALHGETGEGPLPLDLPRG